jgi:hypothetical protein
MTSSHVMASVGPLPRLGDGRLMARCPDERPARAICHSLTCAQDATLAMERGLKYPSGTDGRGVLPQHGEEPGEVVVGVGVSPRRVDESCPFVVVHALTIDSHRRTVKRSARPACGYRRWLRAPRQRVGDGNGPA